MKLSVARIVGGSICFVFLHTKPIIKLHYQVSIYCDWSLQSS